MISMIRKFNFDYDYENDDLFLYDSKSKSKGSIEIDDLVIDFNSDKEVSAIELSKATSFLKSVGEWVDKELLKEIQGCQIDITQKNNFLVLKLTLQFKTKPSLTTPVIVPTINEPSPALAY